MSGIPFDLQPALAAGAADGNVLAIPNSFRHHNFLIRTTNATVSAGAVSIETSNDPNDANTWALIDPVESVANPVTPVAGTDILINYIGVLNFVRARISTAITGGATVQVQYLGGKSY